VVTAIGVVFVRHRDGQNQKGNRILPPLQIIKVHQRLFMVYVVDTYLLNPGRERPVHVEFVG